MIKAMYDTIVNFLFSDMGVFIFRSTLSIAVIYWLPTLSRILERIQEYYNRLLDTDVYELTAPDRNERVVDTEHVKIKMSGDVFVTDPPPEEAGKQTYYMIVKVVVEPNRNTNTAHTNTTRTNPPAPE